MSLIGLLSPMDERLRKRYRPGRRVRYVYTGGPVPPNTLGHVMWFNRITYEVRILFDNGKEAAVSEDSIEFVRRRTA